MGKQLTLGFMLEQTPIERINLRYKLAVSKAYNACRKAIFRAHVVRRRALGNLFQGGQLFLFPKTPFTTP